MDEGAAVSSAELVEDLFRKEYAHLVSALTRVLGPSSIPLAEDVVHDALVPVAAKTSGPRPLPPLPGPAPGSTHMISRRRWGYGLSLTTDR